MANVHGQIARHGITIQAKQTVGFTGNWLSGYIKTMQGNTPGYVGSALNTQGVSKPRWVSAIPTFDRVISREVHRGYTRYPGRRKQNIYLNAEVDLGGTSSSFHVDASVAGLNRKSHKGLDQGATRGNLYVRVRAWHATTGALLVDSGNLSSEKFGYPRISGWSDRVQSPGYWHAWKQTFSAGGPVGRVLVNTRVYTGSENYHDTGSKGSPSNSWNPSHNVGAYFPHNYFGLLAINQSGSFSRTRTINL